MRKTFLGSLFALVFAATAFGQNLSTTNFFFEFADEVKTVSNASVSLTSSVYAPTTNTSLRADRADCVLKCTTTSPCPINVRATGAAVTTITGRPVVDGQGFTIFGRDTIVNFRAIRTGANDGDLWCSYSRR